jgi:cadmium resistance protein CadD (predicted permease)
MKIVDYIKGTFQDKNQNSSGREATVFIFVVVVIISWIAEQFYDKHVPEFMFLGFIGIITAGIGLYTIEKPISDNENKTNININENDNQQNNSKTQDKPAHDI